jgi:hypothetical protein
MRRDENGRMSRLTSSASSTRSCPLWLLQDSQSVLQRPAIEGLPTRLIVILVRRFFHGVWHVVDVIRPQTAIVVNEITFFGVGLVSCARAKTRISWSCCGTWRYLKGIEQPRQDVAALRLVQLKATVRVAGRSCRASHDV